MGLIINVPACLPFPRMAKHGSDVTSGYLRVLRILIHVQNLEKVAILDTEQRVLDFLRYLGVYITRSNFKRLVYSGSI